MMEVDSSTSVPTNPSPLSNFSAVSSRNGMHNTMMRKNGTTARKLNIKNAKISGPGLPDNFYGRSWIELKEAIDAIHESKPTSVNLETLYDRVNDICTHNLSARLYDDLRLVCHQRVSQIARQLTESLALHFDPFLAQVGNQWEQHCQHMVMIRSIFLVIDRKYTLQTAGVNSIWEIGLELFRQCVLCDNNKAICVRTVDGILDLLQRERAGELVNSSLIKCLLRMLSDLHVYGSMFEKRFVDATEHLYRYEGLELIAALDTTEYLKRVSTRLSEEEERASRYLDHSTRKPLIRTVEKQLLEEHVDEILAKGFNALLTEARFDQLKLLFDLFQRAKALLQIKVAFSEYIKLTGSNIVMNVNSDEQMVSELLALKDKVDSIALQCFAAIEMFSFAIREAFESFINKRANKPAEMIAKFIDTRLKSGNKESSEEELERLMDKVMVIFRFIHGKDVFEAFYKKDLAKRLLVGRSASVDAEKSMLSKLKQECGAQFTSKLEGMFKDIELSRDIMTNFKLHLDSRQCAESAVRNATAPASGSKSSSGSTPDLLSSGAGTKYKDEPPEDVYINDDSMSSTHGLLQHPDTSEPSGREESAGDRLKDEPEHASEVETIGGTIEQGAPQVKVSGEIELVVNVLTMGFWPTYPAVEVNLPKEMEQYLECFKQFYLAKHSGRKLKWQSTLGHCIVKARFDAGVKELHVSLFQALVILLFNNGNIFTYQQIKEFTNIEDNELTRTVQSLSMGKKDSRILRKEPLDKDVCLTDNFSIINDFHNKHYRIKINQIQMKETKQEAETTQEQVFADRVYQVDAAVVRIMKTRKTLSHNELVSQLIHQLRFPVKASDLKKRIESLIEREYMKRDSENVNNYIYVA